MRAVLWEQELHRERFVKEQWAQDHGFGGKLKSPELWAEDHTRVHLVLHIESSDPTILLGSFWCLRSWTTLTVLRLLLLSIQVVYLVWYCRYRKDAVLRNEEYRFHQDSGGRRTGMKSRLGSKAQRKRTSPSYCWRETWRMLVQDVDRAPNHWLVGKSLISFMLYFRLVS